MTDAPFPHPAQLAWDDKSKAAITNWENLPPFPSGSAQDQPAAFVWASFMISMHGADAPYFALKAILTCIDAMDHQARRGWSSIVNAIAELSRGPSSEAEVN